MQGAETHVKEAIEHKVDQVKTLVHLAKEKELALIGDIQSDIQKVKTGIENKVTAIKTAVESKVHHVETTAYDDVHGLITGIEDRVSHLKADIQTHVIDKVEAAGKEAAAIVEKPVKAVEAEVDKVGTDIHEDVDKVEADVEKVDEFFKARKTLVWIVLGVLVLSLVIWGVRRYENNHEQAPLLFHFEGVKQLEQMEFVKQHYEEVVHVTDQGGQLEFMMRVPATVSGSMDMTKMRYDLLDDSLVRVTLPEVIISDVVVDLQNVTSYDNKGKRLSLFLSGGGKAYGKAYESIMKSVEETKQGVLSNAIRDDLISETNRQARLYMVHIGNSLGYRMEFIETKPSRSTEKTLEDRVGKKLWPKLKHKVQGVKGDAENEFDKLKDRVKDLEDKKDDK